MLKTLHIRNFRGIESLDIEDLGRVNLLIGRNNSGKTSVMEAAAFSRSAAMPEALHTRKGGPGGLPDGDALRMMFRGGDSGRTLSLSSVDLDGAAHCLQVQAGPERDGQGHDYVLEWDGVVVEVHSDPEGLHGKGVKNLPSGPVPAWLEQSDRSLAQAFRRFKAIYLAGSEGEIVKVLRPLEPHLQSLDLVGEDLWFKLESHRHRLPISLMGDGALWLFAIAVATHGPAQLICLDELDAGLHVNALETTLELIQVGRGDVQFFATTHSDECIRAACEVFRDADDQGLRIIRLDRTESGHRAAIYDRDTALFALENGWEIRG